MKSFKSVLFIAICLSMWSIQLIASSVSIRVTQEVGFHFIAQRMEVASVDDLQWIYSEVTSTNDTLWNVFNVNSHGYIIVAADDAIIPILAYSTEGTLDMSTIPENMRQWVQQYSRQIQFCRENDIAAPLEILQQWQTLTEASPLSLPNHRADVTPLLTATWGQSSPYNNCCPSNCPAGCVAVGMAQIMQYWQYPSHGYGSNTYNHQTYGTLSANFADANYDYANMPNSLTSSSPAAQIAAVSTLVYHCGVAVAMNYSTSGSGSYNLEYSHLTSSAERAMRIHFGFPMARGLQREDFSDAEWISLLKNNLDNGQPILYSGSGAAGGHTFVCDGYDNSNYFHFNFGWSGSANAYFAVSNINPLSYTFNTTQEIVLDLRPSAILPDEHGIIYVTENGAGTQDGSSWENATSQLQEAVGMSLVQTTPCSVWVAGGTYVGNGIAGDDAFIMRAGSHVYGGFAGNESFDYNLDLRNFEQNPSILDGQNVQRVLYQQFAFDENSASVWNGFTIQNGYIASSHSMVDGAGAYIQDYGKLVQCKIKFCENHSEMCYGGGVMSYNGELENCLIANNQCDDTGGGLYAYYSKLSNCIIHNNHSSMSAGGIYADNSILINCDVVQNTSGASTGKNMYAYTSTIYNSIIWCSDATGSLAQNSGSQFYSCAIVHNDANTNNGNISLEERNDGDDTARYYVRFMFPTTQPGIDFENGDWNIQVNSACVDRGTNVGVELPALDYDCNPRINLQQVDIGAYEWKEVDTTSITELFNGEVTVYPNPTHDMLYITLGNEDVSKVYHWQLFDGSGKLLKQELIHSNSSSISLKEFPVGTYILRIDEKNRGRYSQKIVKY